MQIFQNALNQKSAKKCTKEAKNQHDEENEMFLKFNFTTEKCVPTLYLKKIISLFHNARSSIIM